jgi:hypothetical protein
MPYPFKKSEKETLEVFEIERFIKRSKMKRWTKMFTKKSFYSEML